MRYLLLCLVMVGCGDAFESQLFLKGETDVGTVSQDAAFDVGSDLSDGEYPHDSVSDVTIRMGDSSPDGPGQDSDGDAPDATPDTSTCDAYQCQVTCASMGKLCNDTTCDCL